MAISDHQVCPPSLSLAQQRSQFPRAFLHDESPLILIGRGGEGFAWLAEEGDKDTFIVNINVKIGHRRRGLGSALLAKLLDEAGIRNAAAVASATVMQVPDKETFATPSPEVRFCKHHGFEEYEEIDTFHLDGEAAHRLIGRLDRLRDRFANSSLSWKFADSVEVERLVGFVDKNIQLNGRGASPFLKSGKFFPTLSPVAMTPEGDVVGLAVVGCHPRLADRLHYHYLAVDPSYRQTALLVEILSRSIQAGWEEGWRGSEFKVRRGRESAMWRFATRNGRAVSRHVSFRKFL